MLLITFFLTVIVDLTVAIEVGVLLAIALFVRRVMETSSINVIEEDSILATESDEVVNPDDIEQLDIPQGVEVYEVNGPFFFGLASKFEEFNNFSNNNTKVRIIRMRKVPFIDSTGINNLRNLCERTQNRGIQVILSGVNGKVQQTLLKYGIDQLIGPDCIQPHITPALQRAKEIIG